MRERTVYVTEQGLVQLKEELDRLRSVTRLEIIERLEDAKAGGDWMDSAEHTLVEEELAFVEARIQELEIMLAQSELIPPDPDPHRVNIGDTVVVQDEAGALETYTIVGVAEADPAAGFISNECPLAQALLGSSVEDEVEVQAPLGVIRYRVVAVH